MTSYSVPVPVGTAAPIKIRKFTVPAGNPPPLLAWAIKESNTKNGKHDPLLDQIVGGINTVPGTFSSRTYHPPGSAPTDFYDIPAVPFCRDPQFRDTIWCACVNSPAPNPECFSLQCQNPSAYKTTQQAHNIANAATACPKAINIQCENVANLGPGGSSVSTAVQQQCAVTIDPDSGTATPTAPTLTSQPWLIVIIIALVVLAAALLNPEPKRRVKTGI